MSQRSNCSFVLINFAADFFFKQGDLPLASKVVSRKILKSPASVISLFWWISKLLRKSWKLFSTLMWSVSVFALYRLTHLFPMHPFSIPFRFSDFFRG